MQLGNSLAILVQQYPSFILKTQFSRILGAPWQGTMHTDPDISFLISRVASKAPSVDLHLRKPNRETKMRMIDILAKGQEMLRSKVMKAFTKRCKVWVAGTGVFEEEEDDIPVRQSSFEKELIMRCDRCCLLQSSSPVAIASREP